MNHLAKRIIWFSTIFSLALIFVTTGCKKDTLPAGNPPEFTDNSLQGLFASELQAELVVAGLPESQARVISSNALIEANLVMGISSSVRAISKSAVILVAPAITTGAMKSIGDADVPQEKRTEIAGVIAKSIMKSLNGRTGIMDVDKMVVLYKDVSGGAISNMEAGGISDKNATTEEVMNKFVGHLDDAGLPSEDVSVAIKNLNSGAVGGLKDAGLTPVQKLEALGKVTGGSVKALGDIVTTGFSIATASKAVSSGVTESLEKAGFIPQDMKETLTKITSTAVVQLQNIKDIDAATKIQAIGNIASGSVGALGNIKGLTSAQISASSKFVIEGITKSLVSANVGTTGTTDMAKVIENTSAFAIRGLDAAGLPKSYIGDAALGMLDSTYNSLGDANITVSADKAAVLDNIKTAMKASLEKMAVFQSDQTALDEAKAKIDAYAVDSYSDTYGDTLVCSDTNTAGCAVATCSDQKDLTQCGAISGCSWDTSVGVCKEKTDDTSALLCPNGSDGTYPECVCSSGIFDKATNTCVANETKCPSDAYDGTAPDCKCVDANINYDPITNTCVGNACPKGSDGIYPNCSCTVGVYNVKTNGCESNICPAGSSGTYPSCVCTLGKYDSVSNTCVVEGLQCPIEAKGTYPDCSCMVGYVYNKDKNTCDSTLTCPKGAVGTYPGCDCTLNLTAPVYNSSLNKCVPSCPKGTVKGTYPDCVCETNYSYNLTENSCVVDTKCPSGATGVYPGCSCTEGVYNATTNACDIPCPKDATKGVNAPDCGCCSSPEIIS